MGLKHSKVVKLVLFTLLATVTLGVVSACASIAAPLPGVEFTVVGLSPDFSSDGVVFVGTVEHGIFRSDDRGDSWREVNTGIEKTTVRRKGTPEPGPLPPVADIAFSPSFDEDGEAYAVDGQHVYRSVDGGENWDFGEVSPFHHPVYIDISPDYERDRTLFITAMKQGSCCNAFLWRSQDAGASWVQMTGNYYPDEVQYLSDGSIIGATIYRAWRSTDLGRHWSLLFRDEAMGAVSFSPAFSEDGIVFYGDNVGQENVRRRVLGEDEPMDLGFKAGFANICHRQGYGVGCAIPVAISPTFVEDGVAFASAYKDSSRNSFLMRSNDRGVTWEELTLPIDERAISIAMSPKFSEDKTVFVATRSALFVSRDAGDTWERSGY